MTLFWLCDIWWNYPVLPSPTPCDVTFFVYKKHNFLWWHFSQKYLVTLWLTLFPPHVSFCDTFAITPLRMPSIFWMALFFSCNNAGIFHNEWDPIKFPWLGEKRDFLLFLLFAEKLNSCCTVRNIVFNLILNNNKNLIS